MKTNKIFYNIIFMIILCSSFTFTQEPPPDPGFEIKIINHLEYSVYAKLYPVSAIFNGRYTSGIPPKFTLKSFWENLPRNGPGNEITLKYLVGFDKYALYNRGDQPGYFEIPSSGIYNPVWLDHNTSGSALGIDALYGYGLYHLELWVDVHSEAYLINGVPILLDYRDFNYPYGNAGGLVTDLEIHINATTNNGITFKWHAGGTEVNFNEQILPVEDRNNIKCYKQYHGYVNGNWQVKSVTPNVGTHTHGITKSDELLFPIDGTELSNLDYRIPRHDNPGALYSPLYIDYSHQAKVKCGKSFINNSKLLLNGDASHTNTKFIVGDSPGSSCNAAFINNSGGVIALLAYTQFIVENGGKLYLENGSNVIFNNTGKLIMKNGSYYCNRGGEIGNFGNFIIQKGVQFCIPDPPARITNYVNDSASIILETGADFIVPDSTTYIFEGPQSAFMISDSTTVKFGKNSKLIFQDGARINANGCKFVSYDSTEVWDGIYLDGIAYDTLKNCTFQNAVNGINITDNYDPFGSPGAVEISNCTFKNSTSSDLLNYVYVNNSYNVLIKGCNSEKTGLGGFTSGIIAEYCPTNGVVIADNNINYVTTGISLLQSSEYIGRNTITGSTNSGSGIYLDNSNGTIEYNTVNNFQKSVYGSYSSPYMLKNTLSNAYVKNIDLASNSYPVMKPVVSGSTLRWLGGNNTMTGTPTNSGIAFADCYPLMDSGYNRITVNGSDYMNGNFTFSYTTVNAKINYWYDNPPQSSLFDISGGNVNYADPFDGSTLPLTDGTELNSLGWGMYDTVFTKSFGDNSTAEDLFMQAYTEEMSQNYTDAITHYKEVVSSYKTSSFAPVSLSRIFNCLEKSHASISDYQTIQTYYNSIKSNSAYPNESRELAEDFVIKSKVKQGNIEEAANDYNAIYQANQNNSKGLHALLNKYCLENMVQGDNSSGSTNYQDHKMNILSLITGENIKTNIFSNINSPKQFRLLQNYPNPFNPVTNIKFEIPKDLNVSIKIYDIVGREVFSFNEYKKAGSYEVQFDGTNFASGMYFYMLEADGFSDTKKMVLIK